MNPFASTPTKPSVSPEEAAQFKTYFKSLTSTNLASVDSVVKFLSLSNLSQQQLSTVWELSGGLERRNGLVEEEFIIACKLVALFQNGVTARVESLSLKTPMPVFKGMGGLGELTPQKTGQQPSAFSGQTPALVPQRTGQQTPVLVPQRTGQQTPVLVPQRTGQSNQSDLSRSPSISHSMICSAEEKKRFSGFFEVSGPVDGFLSGQIAREIFMKSGLGNDVLGKVWGLVDKDGKGKFNVDQFVAAMWIITKVKMGGLSSVPDSMPVALWNSITG